MKMILFLVFMGSTAPACLINNTMAMTTDNNEGNTGDKGVVRPPIPPRPPVPPINPTGGYYIV